MNVTLVAVQTLINWRRRVMIGLATLLLVWSSQHVLAADYYVAPSGSGNGTLENPGSGVLVAGDKYSLYSAQNFLAGPIKTGIVSGTTISIPMANLTVASVLYGPKLKQPNSTSPEFGAFVLIGEAVD